MRATPLLAVGLSMVAFITIKTGRDAVFFEDRGLFELPLASDEPAIRLPDS